MAEVTNSNYTIRYAVESDVTTILQLINELASYEHALHEVLATEEALKETLSFPDPNGKFGPGYAKTLLIASAEAPESIAGMALYFHNYSTWTAGPGIYLEDLFVRPAYRKKGFGKALLQALGRECIQLKCKRLEWSVLKWNEPSIKFYESEAIGAKMMVEWSGMRVDGEALVKLSNSK